RVKGMQIQPMAPRYNRQGLFEVGAQLVGSARFAQIVAGNGQAAAEVAVRVFKSADVVPLPTVERNRNVAQPVERGFDVDAERSVPFARQSVSFLHSQI